MDIFLDIETIPCQLPRVREDFIANIKPPGTHKKVETIAAWFEENREEEGDKAWRNTSFDGALGHVCVIGWAVNNEPAQEVHLCDGNVDYESSILMAFKYEMGILFTARPNERPRFIGHNLIEFDLKFLFQRHVVLGVRPSHEIPFHCRPWDDNVYDTMQRWGAQRGGSLDRITKACGLDGKDGMDGSMVWDAVKEGRIEEVAKYCKRDVDLVRELYKRMTFQA